VIPKECPQHDEQGSEDEPHDRDGGCKEPDDIDDTSALS
jgi:hypothetical protein